MYITRVSKRKTLLKSNGNYKTFDVRGHRKAKKRQRRLEEYKIVNAKQLQEKKRLLQIKFDKKKAAKLASGWTAKERHIPITVIQSKTLFILVHKAINIEKRRRIEQSNQDKLKFFGKVKGKKLPTHQGNKSVSSSFNNSNANKCVYKTLIKKTLQKAA